MNEGDKIRKKNTLKNLNESSSLNLSKRIYSGMTSIFDQIPRFETLNSQIPEDSQKQKYLFGAHLTVSTNFFENVSHVPKIVDSTANFLLNYC